MMPLPDCQKMRRYAHSFRHIIPAYWTNKNVQTDTDGTVGNRGLHACGRAMKFLQKIPR